MPFFFLFHQLTALHTLHVNLVLIEEVTTVVIKLWRKAWIQIDTFLGGGRKRKVLFLRSGWGLKQSARHRVALQSVMPRPVISDCQSDDREENASRRFATSPEPFKAQRGCQLGTGHFIKTHLRGDTSGCKRPHSHSPAVALMEALCKITAGGRVGFEAAAIKAKCVHVFDLTLILTAKIRGPPPRCL